jgi:YidC/Oxa1 family membrane protein insertase
MDILTALFHEILYRPLFNGLVFFYKVTGDLGVAIIIVTVLIKILLFPLSKKQLKSQHDIKKIQPKINEIKEKNKGDREAQSREMMELYKKEKINPAAGCLPLLVQLPILIALYRVFIPGKSLFIDGDHLRVAMDTLYSFPYLQSVTEIKNTFLGIVDLTQRSIPIALVSSFLQFIQSKTLSSSKKKEKEKEKNKEKEKQDSQPAFQDVFSNQMIYMMPVITFFFGISFPAALPLYWSVSTAITILQQQFLGKKLNKKKSSQKS